MKKIILMSVLFFSLSSFSAEFLAQGRLFLGSTMAQPDNLNQEMTAQGLQEFTSIGKYGVEITYPVVPWLNIGINYSKRNLSRDEVGSSSVTNYEGVINQDSVLLLARLPVFKKGGYVLVDVFAGIGGSNTTFTLKSATQNGELTRREGGDWFASPIAAAGVSAGVGSNNIYFYIEAGFESNKVDSFVRSGSINNNIQTLDMSGSYVSVGLMFDGIKATSSK